MFGRKKSRLIGKRFVAVDFDSNHLHVVEGERVARNLRVGRLSAVEIPEEVDITDAQQFGAFLGGVLKKMKLSGTSLLMTVNRADAVFKPLTLPPGTDPEEMAGMVQFQMQGELPYHAEEAVIDFTGESHYDAESDQPEESAGIDLLVAAVKLPIVDRYRQIAHAAGAKLVRLGLRPYAPVHLRVNGSGGDLRVSWIRRTRIGGDRWDTPEVPLGEESERYLLRVRRGAQVLREVTVTVPDWTYTSAARAEDGPDTGKRIEVAQVSASFGAGRLAGRDL
jgi:hypothetical protein